MSAASAVAADSAPTGVTADMTLDWAEHTYPDLFPAAHSQHFPHVEYLGAVYNARAYSGSSGVRYLGITSDGRIYGLGDFTNGALHQFETIGHWAKLVLADQCTMRPDRCRRVSLDTGGEVRLEDGVSLRVLDRSGSGEVAIFARASGGQPGQTVGESRVVSFEYTIASGDFGPGNLAAPVQISLPIDANLVPIYADPVEFDVQVYNTQSQRWEWVDGSATLDPGLNRVSFWTNHFSTYRVLHSVPSHLDHYSRWQVNFDNFRITYYTPKAPILGAAFLYAPPSNDVWRPHGGGTDLHPDIPNYVEDLDKILNQSLQYFLTIENSAKNKLFKKPSSAPFVRVTHLPATSSGGESKWGMMRISTSLGNYYDLKTVATHELFHVLADQYYTVFGAAYNRWFFEASADLWTTRAIGMSRDNQIKYLGREMSRYLRVSLDASDEGSYYAAADFLDWLEKRTGKAVVADVISADHPWNDLSTLETAVGTTGTSLSEYYTQYVLEASVGRHDFSVPLVDKVYVLSRSESGFTEKIRLPHLSASGRALKTDLTANGMLVVSSARSASTGTDMKIFSYASEKPSGIDIATYLEASAAGAGPIVVKNFGKAGAPGVVHTGLYQIAVNSRVSGESLEYDFDAYVLTPPEMQTLNGRVDFSYGHSYAGGQRPVVGFNVYLDGKALNTSPLPPDAHVFHDGRIQAGANIVVTVVDKYGNEWPEVRQSGIPLSCSMKFSKNETGYTYIYNFEYSSVGALSTFEPPTAGTLSASSFAVQWNFQEDVDRNHTGTLQFDLNPDRTHVMNFNANLRNTYLPTGGYQIEHVAGRNLPARFEAGRMIAELTGTAACQSVSALKRESFSAGGALQDETTRFTCDERSFIRIACE